MNDELTKRILDGEYDASREDSWISMARDFYSRKMRFIAVMVWGWAIVFIALALYCAVRFFKTDQTQMQILFATLFILGVHGVGLMKIFAWEMLVRHGIRRDIKRLELRVAELSETLKAK